MLIQKSDKKNKDKKSVFVFDKKKVKDKSMNQKDDGLETIKSQTHNKRPFLILE